jgi:hypothetical protein
MGKTDSRAVISRRICQCNLQNTAWVKLHDARLVNTPRTSGVRKHLEMNSSPADRPTAYQTLEGFCSVSRKLDGQLNQLTI